MFMAIICESIDADYDEEFEKQAGDIQVVEYLTKKFKLLLGRDVDDDCRVDGEDDDGDHNDKLCFTERQMDAFEESLGRLENFVDCIDVDLQFEENIDRILNKSDDQAVSLKDDIIFEDVDIVDDVDDTEYAW